MDSDVYNYALAKIFYANPAKGRRVAGMFEDLSDLFEVGEKGLVELLNGNSELAGKISDPVLLDNSHKELRWAREKGVSVLFQNNARYPKLLKECADAPMALFYLGSADLNERFHISVVGTRMASGYGREECCSLISSLASDNVLIISGMAYGIDICAHRAALELGLPTVGVLPCGMDSIYPQAHRDTAKRMVENGGIITEFPPGCGVRRWHFLKRNRIIAGMSRCVVVVESRLRGGAIRTAEYANSYNRDVYAVPGRICDTNSSGCNYLIYKNMANIYMCNTFRMDCGLDGTGSPNIFDKKGLFLFDDDKKEKILLSLKVNSLQDADSLCVSTGLTFEEAASILLELEVEGRIVPDKWCRYRIRN